MAVNQDQGPERVLSGAAGSRARDRATPWVQSPSRKHGQRQATMYLQGAGPGGSCPHCRVHSPPGREG